MKILNTTKGSILAENTEVADSFFTRMRGLLHRRDLASGEALVITRCNSIHMFFMRFPIDVVFVDKSNRVVGLTERIQPFRLSRIFWRSSYAVELKAGTVATSRTALGDQLTWQ